MASECSTGGGAADARGDDGPDQDDGSDPPPSEGSAQGPHDLTHRVTVVHGRHGNQLTWSADAQSEGIAGFQLWRDDGEWNLLAHLDAGATGYVDGGGAADHRYKLTAYTSRHIDAGYAGEGTDLSEVSWWRPDLVAVPLQKEGSSTTMQAAVWGLMVASALLLLVGAPLFVAGAWPHRNGDRAWRRGLAASKPTAASAAPRNGHSIQTIVDGDDGRSLQRLRALGVTTLADLVARDADALALWLDVEVEHVRRWQAAARPPAAAAPNGTAPLVVPHAPRTAVAAPAARGHD